MDRPEYHPFDTPPPSDDFVCGGGICVCRVCEPQLAHLDG